MNREIDANRIATLQNLVANLEQLLESSRTELRWLRMAEFDNCPGNLEAGEESDLKFREFLNDRCELSSDGYTAVSELTTQYLGWNQLPFSRKLEVRRIVVGKMRLLLADLGVFEVTQPTKVPHHGPPVVVGWTGIELM